MWSRRLRIRLRSCINFNRMLRLCSIMRWGRLRDRGFWLRWRRVRIRIVERRRIVRCIMRLRWLFRAILRIIMTQLAIYWFRIRALVLLISRLLSLHLVMVHLKCGDESTIFSFCFNFIYFKIYIFMNWENKTQKSYEILKILKAIFSAVLCLILSLRDFKEIIWYRFIYYVFEIFIHFFCLKLFYLICAMDDALFKIIFHLFIHVILFASIFIFIYLFSVI